MVNAGLPQASLSDFGGKDVGLFIDHAVYVDPTTF